MGRNASFRYEGQCAEPTTVTLTDGTQEQEFTFTGA